MCGIWLGVVVEQGQHQPPARCAPSCDFPRPKLAWGEGSRVRGRANRSRRTPVSVTERVGATKWSAGRDVPNEEQTSSTIHGA
jgi:hypothetical protein